jgi:hypothetical protein
MAQPKTGNSHLRGSQFIGSGLYVSGVARVAGAVNIGGALTVTGALVAPSLSLSSHMTGIQIASGAIKQRHLGTGSLGPLYHVQLNYAPIHGPSYTTKVNIRDIRSETGVCAPGLKFMAPGVAITIRGIAFSFQTAPASTGLRVGIRSIPSSGAQVHKAYVTTLAAKIAVYKSGLTATIPAQNACGFSINRAGTSASGSNLGLTVYYTLNANP